MKDAFEYQAPTQDMIDKITVIRNLCKILRNELEATMPECRERSLAITKLEECSMWANKGIVFRT